MPISAFTKSETTPPAAHLGFSSSGASKLTTDDDDDDDDDIGGFDKSRVVSGEAGV